MAAIVRTFAFTVTSRLRQHLDAEQPACGPKGSIRGWSGPRIKRAWKRLAKGPLLAPEGVTRSAYGVLLADRQDDVTFRFCVKGTYGFFFANALRRWRRPYALLDVGANVGLYSLVAAKTRMAKRVIGFEPDPDSAEFLRQNARKNGVSVEVVEAAVSDVAGQQVLSVPTGHSGASSLGASDASGHHHLVRTLSGETLDEVVGPLPEGLDVIVKLDVEGHESNALSGLRRWNRWDAVAALWVEFSDRTDRDACIDILDTDGFVAVAHVGGGGHLDVLYVREALLAHGARTGVPRDLLRRRCSHVQEAH